MDAVRRVLKGDGLRGGCFECIEEREIELRVWLNNLYIIGTADGVEIREDAQTLQVGVYPAVRGTGREAYEEPESASFFKVVYDTGKDSGGGHELAVARAMALPQVFPD